MNLNEESVSEDDDDYVDGGGGGGGATTTSGEAASGHVLSEITCNFDVIAINNNSINHRDSGNKVYFMHDWRKMAIGRITESQVKSSSAAFKNAQLVE